MKFWLSLVSVRETEQLPELARFAEDLGFHGLMVGDHLLWPAEIETPYPYSPDGNLVNPMAGNLYGMFFCDGQNDQPVYFLGRMYRVEPGGN